MLKIAINSLWSRHEILADPDEDWFQQQENDLNAAYSKLSQHGVDIKYPILSQSMVPFLIVSLISSSFNSFLSTMESTPVRTVEELVKFNEQHSDIEMPPEAPNQDTLLAALDTEPWTQAQTDKRLAEGEQYAGTDGIDRVLQENNVNLVLGPADSWLTDFACIAGYPSAMLPLSFWDKNGRPFGVIALTSKWSS